jgi:hypothetical protein
MNNLKSSRSIRLTPDQDKLLSGVADSLRKGDQVAAQKPWRQLIESFGKPNRRVSEEDLEYLIQLAISRAGWTGVSRAENMQAQIEKIASQFKYGTERQIATGDDAQLANVDLQNMLQKQQQTLQMMSNISKMLHDTAMAVIRKIGG